MMFQAAQFTIFALLLSTAATAGTWSSSGGFITRDEANPWFIQNTSKIKYCIVWDPNTFHLNERDGLPLDELIERAFDYWRVEFKEANNPVIADFVHYDVATQELEKRDCDDSVDIRFQFGVLSEEQRQFFSAHNETPRDYVSIAVRTSYDAVHLQAKGFVYLSADTGDLRPNFAGSPPDNPWAKGSGAAIFKVLVHELGHVFGLSHHGHFWEVMGAEFPTVSVYNDDVHGSLYKLPYFFKVKEIDSRPILVSHWSADQRRFFGVPAGAKYVKHSLKNSKLVVEAGAAIDSLMAIGSAIVTTPSSASESPIVEKVVQLWLPPEQQVFKKPTLSPKFWCGPGIIHERLSGQYEVYSSGVRRPLWMTISPRGFGNENWVSGLLGGRLVEPLLSLQPPSFVGNTTRGLVDHAWRENHGE